jgi:hypothetical protein
MSTTLAVAQPATPRPERKAPRRPLVRCTAEVAECTCPEYCDRDHDRD